MILCYAHLSLLIGDRPNFSSEHAPMDGGRLLPSTFHTESVKGVFRTK